MRSPLPWLLVAWVAWVAPTTALAGDSPWLARIAAMEGTVRYLRADTTQWVPLPAGATNWFTVGDQLSTEANSGVNLILRGGTPMEIGPLTLVRFREQEDGAVIRFFRGIADFFNRDRPQSYEIEAGGVNMVVRGTEFAIKVADNDDALLTLFDGEVEMRTADQQAYTFSSGDVVTVRAGEVPRKTAAVTFGDWTAIQWALYYPAILDLEELGWSTAPDPAIAPSRELYRRGNLPRALAAYPADRTPASTEERLFLAALLLSVGNVDEARRWLDSIPGEDRLASAADAHRRLIATVLRSPKSEVRSPKEVRIPKSEMPLSPPARGHPTSKTPDRRPQTPDPQLSALNPQPSASSLLADSYQLQVEGRLPDAREFARAATEHSPDFGFAWVRLAELEFSLGNTRAAQRALDRALYNRGADGHVRGSAPGSENAEAHALLGFILAAANRIREAESSFQTAITLDPSLGNAWLGRGLCRIRRGDLEAGRTDLLLAAAAEPQRSVLRSYLAKAFLDSAPFRAPPLADKAGHELDLARRLDPKDPTPDLYAALLNQQANRINTAITNLERSVELNTNRYVYRSDFLLDQDQAVRSANLASLYADAGMSEVSVREATRAVNRDYANASAHLFLANSYNALRDPRQVNLRYEAPWFSEFLLANLLAPVGAGTLSQTVSQNEYSKLFERDGLGVVSETLWTSNGDWLESAAQVGQFGNFEYALDAHYRSEVGQRPNNDLEQLTLSLNAKAQLSLADTLFLQGIYYDAESGDPNQYYDPEDANPAVRLRESQEPILLAGWHHEWTPDLHTLALVSPWNVQGRLTNPLNRVPAGSLEPDGSIELEDRAYSPGPDALEYSTRYTGFSAELQQLWQVRAHTLIGGLRYQSGEFATDAALDVRYFYGESDQPLIRDYGASPGMQRFSVYGYDQWRVLPWVLVSAGLSYDRLDQPVNFTAPPLTSEEDSLDQVSPKLGLTLTPWQGGTLRAAYARSLGGVSFDQSYRLEPSQVAGFTQSYRGLMPESLVALVPGQDIETWGVTCEQNLPTRTYLAVSAQQSDSDATHGIGAFLWDEALVEYVPGTLTESLDFRERTLFATANQLVGEYLAFGANYRLSEAELDSVLVNVNDSTVHLRSTLHRLVLSARFNHPCGFFARWDSTWNAQSNYESAAGPDYGGGPGDNFWQHDVWAGWRFWQRRAELAVGVLNLTDQDYHLCPLTHYVETYRTRTFAVSARFSL